MEQLEAYGYRPDGIQLKEKDKILFLKLVDKSGRNFYLDLQGKEIEVSTQSITLEKGKEINVPNSLLRGSLSCVEPEISAVALECNEGVCVLSRGSRFNLEEMAFLNEEFKPKQISSFPVIKLAEFSSNPSQIEKSLQICVERICKSELKACCSLLEEVPCALKEVNACWETLTATFLTKKNELLASLAELEKYKCAYERNCNTFCTKYQVVLYNLKIRREKLEDLISLCKSFYCVKDNLLGLAEEFKEDKCWLDREICDLKYVVPLPQ